MAIITKLRESKIVIFVVAGALILFVIGEIIQNVGKSMQVNDQTVGIIQDKSIDINEFENLVEQEVQRYKVMQNLPEVSEEIRKQFREQVWGDKYTEIVLGDEYKALGLSISEKEWNELFYGNGAHQIIKNYFPGQAGGVDEASIKQFLAGVQRKDLRAISYYEYIRKGVQNEVLNARLGSFLKKGIFTTNLEIDNDNQMMSGSYSGKVIKLDYSTVADNEIKVTPEDLSAYLSKHREEYKQEENRDFEYVLWETTPSSADSAEAFKNAMAETEVLRTTENDTAYFESQEEGYNNTYARRGELVASLGENIEDQLFASPARTTIGPIYKDGKYVTVKSIKFKQDTLRYVRVSHILVQTTGADSAAKYAEAVKILAEARAGDFAKVAAAKSEDPGSAQKGGDIGWFADNTTQLVKEFVDYARTHNFGEMGIVKSQFGYHIMKVTGIPTSTAIQIGTISYAIEPGEQTREAIKEKIAQFRAGIKDGDAESFNKQVEKFQITPRDQKNFRPDSREIPGVKGSREIVVWLFDEGRKKGEISQLYSLENVNLIVQVNGVHHEGYANVEDVKTAIEKEVKNEKKAAKIKDKIANAMKGATTIEALASKLQIQPLVYTDVTPNGMMPEIGADPMVNGVMQGMKLKELSKPFTGLNGVYVLLVENYKKPEAISNYDNMRLIPRNYNPMSNESMVIESLRKPAKIKDYRYKFF